MFFRCFVCFGGAGLARVVIAENDGHEGLSFSLGGVCPDQALSMQVVVGSRLCEIPERTRSAQISKSSLPPLPDLLSEDISGFHRMYFALCVMLYAFHSRCIDGKSFFTLECSPCPFSVPEQSRAPNPKVFDRSMRKPSMRFGRAGASNPAGGASEKASPSKGGADTLQEEEHEDENANANAADGDGEGKRKKGNKEVEKGKEAGIYFNVVGTTCQLRRSRRLCDVSE